MAWIKRKGSFWEVDSKIVEEGFIIARGDQTVGPCFLEKEKNPFNRNFYIPVFYLFKVHRNHPLRIFSGEFNRVNILPQKRNNRMLGEIYKDRMAYDLTTFLLSPYDVDEKELSHWKKFNLKNSFEATPSNARTDSCLLYLEHGWDIHPQDNLVVSEVIPSQVISHFYNWINEGNKIWSHDHTGQGLEGRIEVPFKIARQITKEVSKILEERYKTKLLFDQLRGMA